MTSRAGDAARRRIDGVLILIRTGNLTAWPPSNQESRELISPYEFQDEKDMGVRGSWFRRPQRRQGGDCEQYKLQQIKEEVVVESVFHKAGRHSRARRDEIDATERERLDVMSSSV